VLLGGRSYHAREEVQALLVALTAIEWPDDELSVYATLRGPLFALTDEALFRWRTEVGSFHTMRPRSSEALSKMSAPVADALAVLGDLHPRRNRRPVADTITELLARTRAHAGIALWRSGAQALGNVLRLLDLARRFEAAGALSFRGFLERLAVLAERGGAGDAPLVEEGAEGVTLINAHKAKGLEFPVVVLCDPTAKLSLERPSRYSDPSRGLSAIPLANCAPSELTEHAEEVLARDRAEGVRLAYVAATRARDLLVVPAVADAPFEGSWLSPLWKAIYPSREKWRAPDVASGCPAFTWDGVMDRPESAWQPERGVAPGAHVGDAGDPEDPPRVVWWDSHALTLDRAPAAGLRKEALLAASDEVGGSDEGEAAYSAWRAERDETLQASSAAALRVETATALAGTTTSAPAVPIERTSAWDGDAPRAPRPHGPRFGTLVHAVLAEVPTDAPLDAIDPVTDRLARTLFASPAETHAAKSVVRAALEHPLLVRAFAADARREMPLVHRRDDGTIVEGVLDLAFREETPNGPRWTVVDYKTDLGPIDPQGRYAAQLALYVEAITAATGEPAEAILLRV
jgi:ATP-dependent exoDNAse (exonuclease V) beta subunit